MKANCIGENYYFEKSRVFPPFVLVFLIFALFVSLSSCSTESKNEKELKGILESTFLRCGDSLIIEGDHPLQLKNMKISIKTDTLTESDQLNNITWKGEYFLNCSSIRAWSDSDHKWSAWFSPEHATIDRGRNVFKQNGKWQNIRRDNNLTCKGLQLDQEVQAKKELSVSSTPDSNADTISNADTKNAVAKEIKNKQEKGLVNSQVIENSFQFDGEVTNVSPIEGSGGFWSFSFKKDDSEFEVQCSGYSELYIRDGEHDIDKNVGYGLLQKLPKNVTLFFPKDKEKSIITCINKGGCADIDCPKAINIKRGVKMETVGKLFLFGGLAISILSQLYIIVNSFKVRVSAGLFCLIITPIYAFVSAELRNNGKIKPALKVWFLGLGLIIFSIFLF